MFGWYSKRTHSRKQLHVHFIQCTYALATCKQYQIFKKEEKECVDREYSKSLIFSECYRQRNTLMDLSWWHWFFVEQLHFFYLLCQSSHFFSSKLTHFIHPFLIFSLHFTHLLYQKCTLMSSENKTLKTSKNDLLTVSTISYFKMIKWMIFEILGLSFSL